MMKPVKPGLRVLRYDSKQVGKVDIRVQPNDVLHVSEDLAGQLQAADGHFKAEPDVTLPADAVQVTPDPDVADPPKTTRRRKG